MYAEEFRKKRNVDEWVSYNSKWIIRKTKQGYMILRRKDNTGYDWHEQIGGIYKSLADARDEVDHIEFVEMMERKVG